jgi:hypothetical protein
VAAARRSVLIEYEAPWSRTLWTSSALGTLLCLGIAGWTLWFQPAGPRWVAALPLLIVATAALFTVRRYALHVDGLSIHRLLWDTRLPLQDLRAIRHDAQAMAGSVRTLGNGGLYSFSGWYRSKSLGSFRAYVTDPQRAVVLTFADRSVVVSPAEPERFVRDLLTLHPLVPAAVAQRESRRTARQQAAAPDSGPTAGGARPSGFDAAWRRPAR